MALIVLPVAPTQRWPKPSEKETQLRLIGTLGLVVCSVLTVVALAADAASADTFCEKNVGHASECPVGQRLRPGEHLKGVAANPRLLNQSGTILEECATSEALAVIAQGSAHAGVEFEVESITWTGCKGECATVKSPIFFNYRSVAEALTLLVHIFESGITTLKGCSFLNLECSYELFGGKGLFGFEDDLLVASKVRLGRVKPCNAELIFPTEAFWDAKYLVTLDGNTTPVYLAPSP